MFPLRAACIVPLVAFIGLPAASSQDAKKDTKEDILSKVFEDRRDLTLLKRIAERTFVHEKAEVAYTVPEGWKEIRPHRLSRKIDPRISTVLGIERPDRDLNATLYWVPLDPTQKLSEWVRDSAVGGEYGEEYETLKAVYGKDRVTIPTRIKHGAFDVYRINITGGPTDKYDGTVYIFAVESGGATWMMKARVTFPKGDRGRNDQYAMDVLQGYSRVPPKAGGLEK
jgi:hypothetical protein